MSYSDSRSYYANNISGIWESELVPGSGPIALDSSDNPHIVYSDEYSLKYMTNKSGTWQSTTIYPHEGIPDHMRAYLTISGSSSCIAIDSDDSVHITYGGSIDASTRTLRYATNKIPSYNISGKWTYLTKDNWSPTWCDPGKDSFGAVTIEQDGNDVKATVTKITKKPITFEGKAAGSSYELLATFPEDNGETTMIISFMASSDSNATGPQIWIYREPPSYCYGGSSIEYERSSSSVPVPSQGTIGTEITITGQNLGVKKGKVAIGSMKCKVLEWTDTSISGLIKKVPRTMGPDTYDVTIQPKGKGIGPIVLPNAFSIMGPSIDLIDPDSGSPKDEVTITGSFFGTKKVKAYMGDGIGKSKKGKVVSLTMDANTGASRLVILVPKKLAPGLYDVTVTNKVGEDTVVGGFTIQ
jgi:hypothetical protein